MTRSVRRRLAVLVTALGVALGPVACGASKDEWAGRGEPVSLPAEPTPSPASDRFVVGLGELRMALEARVIAAAGVVRPVKSECDLASIIVPKFSCRITYLDEVVTYQVTTERKPGSTDTFNWEAKPDTLVATRQGIEAALWRKYSTRASEIRCDAELPERRRVPAPTTLPHRCYFKPIASDAGYGKDTHNLGKTVAVEITIRDGGIGFAEKVQ